MCTTHCISSSILFLSSIKTKKEHIKGWSDRLVVRSAGPGLIPSIYMVRTTFFNSSPRKSMSPSALLACLCALRCQGIHVDKIPTYIKGYIFFKQRNSICLTENPACTNGNHWIGVYLHRNSRDWSHYSLMASRLIILTEYLDWICAVGWSSPAPAVLNNGSSRLRQLSLPIISVNIYSRHVLLLGGFLEVNLICIRNILRHLGVV